MTDSPRHDAKSIPVLSTCLRILNLVNNSTVYSGVSFDVKFVVPIPGSGTADEVFEITVSVPTVQGDGTNPPVVEYPNGGIVEAVGDSVPNGCNALTHKVYKQAVRITVKSSRYAQIKLYEQDGTSLTLQDSVSVGVVV